jgi:hypothetical protein
LIEIGDDFGFDGDFVWKWQKNLKILMIHSM